LDVYGQRYDMNGSAVGGNFQINNETLGIQGLPTVTGLTGGGFVVTWSSWGQDGDDFGIYGKRFSDVPAGNGGTIASHGIIENNGTINNISGTIENNGTINNPGEWVGGFPVLPEIFKGDINLDGVINETDLNYILKHWGESNVQPTSSGSGLISRLMDNIKNRDIIIKDRDIIIKDRDIIIKQLRNN